MDAKRPHLSPDDRKALNGLQDMLLADVIARQEMPLRRIPITRPFPPRFTAHPVTTPRAPAMQPVMREM